MPRVFFFACCFFVSILIVIAQIKDCKEIEECTAENNLTFSGGAAGSRIYIEHIRCSDGLCCGGVGEGEVIDENIY